MLLFKAVELELSNFDSTYVRLRLDDAYAPNPNVLGWLDHWLPMC